VIIGLGHKARQGKNTAALAILNATPLDTDVRVYAFADALRREVNTAIRQAGSVENLIATYKEAGLMPEWVVAEKPMEKQRTLLQWWGTDHRRAKNPDYWVDRLFAVIGEMAPDVAIITDVRYPNEVAAIKAHGGFTVKVSRTSPPDVVVHEHVSEAALNGYTGWDFDITAANVRELRNLAAAVYYDLAGRTA
jgi:hypothetical protein